MREVLAKLVSFLNQGGSCVFCSVVETRGSTPQKAGAAMLIFPDGSQSGTLGGGCVEAEVKRRALDSLHDPGEPRILNFCLDEDYGWDDGLICGGRMTILVQALNPAPASNGDRFAAQRHYYNRYQELIEQGSGCTEAVMLVGEEEFSPGQRFLFDSEGMLAARLPLVPQGSNFDLRTSTFEWQSEKTKKVAIIKLSLRPLQSRPRPATHHGVAYLPIWPRITLLIVGGGHVGQAVAKLAAEVDFNVWVLDDRESYASHERFPRANRVLVGDIGSRLRELAGGEIGPNTYAIIVTRGHAHDEEALYHLATSRAGYVGMIGSKRKIKLIYEDLVAKGISPEALARVHAPLGLDIGSQSVGEIAISIAAELIAQRNLGNIQVPPRQSIRAGNS
jgi:xanthine dehydrogenase accessory factor